MDDTPTVFEQPLNEHIRACLSLEALFHRLTHYLPSTDPAGSRTALHQLLRIINVIDRPDLKSKLLNTLRQLAKSLENLKTAEQIDINRLNQTLTQLHHHINSLQQSRNKLSEGLQKSEFLNQMRLHLNNPAGICEHALPAYTCWLACPSKQRIADLTQWTASLADLQQMIALLLNLLRNTSKHQHIECRDGYHQQSQDPACPADLLRVTLPPNQIIYPEFSVGKHRINIRFMAPDFHGSSKGTQITTPIKFGLTISTTTLRSVKTC